MQERGREIEQENGSRAVVKHVGTLTQTPAAGSTQGEGTPVTTFFVGAQFLLQHTNMTRGALFGESGRGNILTLHTNNNNTLEPKYHFSIHYVVSNERSQAAE